MDIYYAASIWGAQGDPEFNLKVIHHLKRHGSVLSEQLFLPDYRTKEHLDTKQIHDRDIGWVRKAERIVAEVSAPSLGVGYELREAVNLGKPILALWAKHETKRLSAMISGSPGIIVCEYANLEEALKGIGLFFEK